MVVLQDQSQVSGFHGIMSNFQEARVNPVIAIDSLIRENGANTILYMTWGRKNGDPMNPSFYPDFKAMNQRLKGGYILYRDAISTHERPVIIAPVGLAFEAIYDAVLEEEGIDPLANNDVTLVDNQFTKLYKGDGSHPSNMGAYLSACVLVTSMTGEDPREWAWKPNSIGEEERDSMQEFAWKAVQDFASEQHVQQPLITVQPSMQPSYTMTVQPQPYATTTSPTAQPSEESSKVGHGPTNGPVTEGGNTGSPTTQQKPADTTNLAEIDTPRRSGASKSGRRFLLYVDVLLLPIFLLVI